MSGLADRIREVVRSARPQPESAPIARDQHPAPPESILGGAWCDEGDGPCLVVERRVDPDVRHGRFRVSELAKRLASPAADAAMLAGCGARAPLMFVDLETTGLSGGAGTYAFLVGCGSFDEDGAFATRQYVLVRLADERPLLAAVARELARAGALVSFNGKSFDAPLLETRYLFHRLPWAGGALPHLDVLHPARRFWGSAARSLDGAGECSLTALERRVVGARRSDDVPGFEAPARYFRFVRSGDARTLVGVLEHNRHDLLSLAALAARLLCLVREGAPGACDAWEALALGRVYSRAGCEDRAADAYRRAVELSDGRSDVRIESVRALAIALRRQRRFGDAADRWRELLAVPGCPPHVAREAAEALAIHHEHRIRDLSTAKHFALTSLGGGAGKGWAEAVRHRLARLDRKIERETPAFRFQELET